MTAYQPFKLALFSMLLLVFLYPIASYCDSRPVNAKRISTINSVKNESMDESGGWSTSLLTTYYYDTEYPDLIDSLRSHKVYSWATDMGSGSTVTDTSVVYHGGKTYYNGFTYFYYVTSQNETISIIKDYQNRVIDFNQISSSSTESARRIMSFYNPSDKLDSVKVTLSNGTNTYVMNHNDSGFLDTIYYHLENGTQLSSFQITYPQGLPTNPVDLNIEEVLQYYDDGVLSRWRMIFDPHYQLNSFYIPEGSAALSLPVYTYNPNYMISFSCNTRNYELTFNTEGFLIKYHIDYFMNGVSKSIDVNFTWETIVPNDDPIAPTPSLSLNVYPNPFSNRVNIDLKDTATAPSDIAIYNIKGQLIRKWDENRCSSVTWDGKDRFNTEVGRGVYLIQVKQDGRSKTSKIVKF